MISATQHHGFATYQEIAQVLGLPKAGSYMGSVLGNIIGTISQNEVQNHRPMLSAISVGVNGKPGEGFFNWARELGQLKPGEDEMIFWENECKKVYEEWKITYRISKKSNYLYSSHLFLRNKSQIPFFKKVELS